MSELEYIKKYQFDFISLRLQVAAREKGFEMSKRGTSGTCARQRSLDFCPCSLDPVGLSWTAEDVPLDPSGNFRKFPGLKTNGFERVAQEGWLHDRPDRAARIEGP
jgi:hypothetical protein